MQGIDCGDRKYIGGATVYSHRQELSDHFMDNVECKIVFKSENKDWKIMLRFLKLDIPDILPGNNRICNDGLYIYDSDDIFTGPMVEAGGNFGLCGTSPPPVLYSSGQFMTVHFRSDGGGLPGTGFKFIVTAFSEDYKTYNTCGSSFMCDSTKCIDEDLTCDDVDHCGDYSDEALTGRAKCRETEGNYSALAGRAKCRETEDNSFFDKFLALGVTASVTITVGSLIVIVVCLVALVCCCKRTFCKPPPDSTSGTTTTTSSVLTNGTPVYNQSHTSGSYTSRDYAQHGYFPMQPVHTHPAAGLSQGALYSAYVRENFTNANIANSGSAYSSHSHSHSQPTSYHRSYTPTSSRSGKSNRSNNSTSVTYSQGTEKITLPVNL
ncbi:hypothetical protein FSP39_021658 [Pinctada imbricata]|uniref:CUB domain-containing protein n=1 Tax=Pinctada imbricata TaxID=66713 RepID=A0AA89BL76_PINIB|nr:hypothetical protein FSP39_021658 [Pinctada imbricata]